MKEKDMAKRYGMVIDLNRCIGCHTCTIACKAENGLEKGSWIHVNTVGGPYPDTPSGTYPDLKMYYLPQGCMHCAEAPCMESCAIEAIERRADGIVAIDEEACDGCGACVDACPYGSISLQEEKGIAGKCHFCHERVEDGEIPFCVLCCETRAMHFGDLNDPESPVSKLIKDKAAYVLSPEKGTGPAVFYFPQMP
jgi:Fe-S-cluster-containing dehydrogenase component